LDLSIHNVRATGSYIAGTNGTSNGIVPMLRVFNDTARYVDQGGGKRKGSFAIYVEPWHADIFDFLRIKKESWKRRNACTRFILCHVDSRFIHETCRENADWTLMCPNECPDLYNVMEMSLSPLSQYEKEGKEKNNKARDLWEKI